MLESYVRDRNNSLFEDSPIDQRTFSRFPSYHMLETTALFLSLLVACGQRAPLCGSLEYILSMNVALAPVTQFSVVIN